MTNHDAAYVAELIGKTVHWVKRNPHKYPHSRAGRTYFWTDADVRDFLDALRVRPNKAPIRDDFRPIPQRTRQRVVEQEPGFGGPRPDA